MSRPNRSRRWWRRAKDAVARFESQQKYIDPPRRRGGPPPDNSFFQSLLPRNDLQRPYAEHPGVFTVVSAIVESVIRLPFDLYTGDKAEPEPVVSGEWYDLLNFPSPRMDSATLWRMTSMWYLLGSAYWILRGKDGKLSNAREMPRYIQVVPGDSVTPLAVDGQVVGYTLSDSGTGLAETFATFEVIPFGLPDPYREYAFLPPIDPARRSVRTDVKAHEWNESSLDNQAEPAGVLTTDQALSDDEFNRLRTSWNDRHQGFANARKTAILEKGVEWKPSGFSPKDMEFQATAKRALMEIAMVYRVPKLAFGIMDEIHSKESARVTMQFFWELAVFPHTTQFSRILDTCLFRERGADVWGEFNSSAIGALQADELERRKRARIDWMMGVPFDEVNKRHALGYEELPGGETGFIPGGLVPVEFAADPLGPVVEGEPAPADAVDAVADVAAEIPPADQDIQVAEEFVLNGAQVQAALAIVMSVANGELPRDSGLGMLEVLFNLTTEQAETIMGSAGTSTPTTPNPNPATEPDPVGDANEDRALLALRAVRLLGEPKDAAVKLARSAVSKATWQRSVAVIADRARSPKREALWLEYIRTVQRPGEKKMLGVIINHMRDVRREVLRFIGKTRTVRADDQGEEQDGPSDGEEWLVAAVAIEKWLNANEERWNKALAKKAKPATQFIVDQTFARLDKQLPHGLTLSGPRDPKVLKWIETNGARQVKQITKTTVKQIRSAMITGLAKNETVTEISQRLKTVMNKRAGQALTIARTETGMAAQGAKQIGMEAAGVEKHEWVTAGDELVRETHQIDGQVRKVGDEFSNGLEYPLDPSGPPEEIINCRCDTIPV